MYSMNYIGKFIANFREFYNEINGATLTGAIDVVVVEQPDGSFTCSPFHVRFGKLGVLRSRFKVVDLELNGEPLNIHMKLGESGEAFFVEEVPEDELETSAHLATSPIPDSHFDRLYHEASTSEVRRRKSISTDKTELENQVSNYTQRRYTDGASMHKPEFKSPQMEKFEFLNLENQKEALEKAAIGAVSDQEVFQMEDLDLPCNENTLLTPITPKTFKPAEVNDISAKIIGVGNDFRPIAPETTTPRDNNSVTEETRQNSSNGKKKKKTKKAGSKKKHQRKSSSSSSNSSQSDRVIFDTHGSLESARMPPSDFCSDTEIVTPGLSNHNNTNAIQLLSVDGRIPLALSDTVFEVHNATRTTEEENLACGSSPAQSDTEVERARSVGRQQSWKWGQLPEPPVHAADNEPNKSEPLSSDDERTVPSDVKSERRSMLSGVFNLLKSGRSSEPTKTDGVYLQQLEEGMVAPDIAALYFPQRTQHHEEDEYESGNGPSLPQSPAELEPSPPRPILTDEDILERGFVSLSLCGRPTGASRPSFEAAIVDWSTFSSDPTAILADERLVVRIGDLYLPWRAAAPQIIAMLVYHNQLPKNSLDDIINHDSELSGMKKPIISDDLEKKCPEEISIENKPAKAYSWWSWRRTMAQNEIDQPITETAIKESVVNQTQSEILPAVYEHEAVTVFETLVEEIPHIEAEVENTKTHPELKDEIKSEEDSIEHIDMFNESCKDDSIKSEMKTDLQKERKPAYAHHRHRNSGSFRKTLRLSSEQIACLNLREGMNEMVFSVTTAYQGTTRCKCNLFRWRYDDKIVISDIDGTITKSDVLGHIFPLVGKDWAQSGVAQLFTKIKNNGYKLLYLSARAIGQARVTREYLRSIRQGSLSLPDGPLLLNPTSLLRAFHREVIEKKPEEFKIQCLADIRALFPSDTNPFYAGYGNRVNDVCAYQAVGVPIMRIFTINYKGELKHELTQTFQSTYVHMSYMVDAVFPATLTEASDFSACVFWRDPLPSIPENST